MLLTVPVPLAFAANTPLLSLTITVSGWVSVFGSVTVSAPTLSATAAVPVSGAAPVMVGGGSATTFAVTVSVSAGSAWAKPLGLEPVGESVIVAVCGPACVVSRVTVGPVSTPPAPTPLNVSRPEAVKPALAALAKLPESWSAGPEAVLSTPKPTTSLPELAATVPRSSV